MYKIVRLSQKYDKKLIENKTLNSFIRVRIYRGEVNQDTGEYIYYNTLTRDIDILLDNINQSDLERLPAGINKQEVYKLIIKPIDKRFLELDTSNLNRNKRIEIELYLKEDDRIIKQQGVYTVVDGIYTIENGSSSVIYIKKVK